MRQRDGDGISELEAAAHTVVEPGDPEQSPRGEPADGNDHSRIEQPELPLEPEAAKLELPRGRRTVAPTGWMAPGIAARHRRAVEKAVEFLLVELEPATQRPAGATAPRPPLLALDDSRRLPDDHGALTRSAFEDGQRLQREPCLRARAANAVVPLQGGQRAIEAFALDWTMFG
jgi:hypothetical protein